MTKEPSKYSKEWFNIHGPEHGHANPFKAASNDWPVRLSKSAFMTYLGCPRKYWWGNVAEIRGPANHFMVHGTAVHRALENLYGNWSVDTDKNFEGLMAIDYEDQSSHQPHLEWDDMTELKTGKATSGKLSKTRKELCYYLYMLSLLGWDEAVYFYYLFPEAMNTKLYHELDGKKNTEVWLGDLQGMAVLEKVGKRSMTAMHKSLEKTFDGIDNSLWNIKWNDYFCSEWCEFNMSCESQLLGIDEDPTLLYSADEEW